jgi:DNA-binding NarL/FixJ family response regulator
MVQIRTIHPKGGPIETHSVVLVVEDSAIFRTLLKETLQSRFRSIEIFEAAGGEEAMRQIAAHPPDLIFMDIKLPGENGLDLTARIKAEYPRVTVVVLTSYDTQEYREAAVRAKADHFLAKGSSSRQGILTLVESVFGDR